MNFQLKNTLAFWKWFDENSEDLFNSHGRGNELLKEIDTRVAGLGPFDWEIGPSENGLSYFAISPNLNPDVLTVTAAIISYATPNKNWIFLNSKPRKPYVAKWSMKNDLGESYTVDTSMWSYVLYYFPDKTFDMDLRINGTELGIDDRDLAVDIALTNILGEKMFMEYIKDIKIVEEFDELSGPSAFEHLYSHILQVVK